MIYTHSIEGDMEWSASQPASDAAWSVLDILRANSWIDSRIRRLSRSVEQDEIWNKPLISR